MSMYSELLRLALAQDQSDLAERSPGELLAELAARRTELAARRAALGRRDLEAGTAPEWITALLEHDMALTRLCRRLGIDHQLTDPSSGPGERRRVEEALARRGIDLGPDPLPTGIGRRDAGTGAPGTEGSRRAGPPASDLGPEPLRHE